MSRQRLDVILLQFFPDWTRSKLQVLIEKGHVEVFTGQWKVERRPGAKFPVDELSLDRIRIIDDEEFQYVSRGALKLKQAVELLNIPIKGRTALDVGLSTGGFSDYLLQNGIGRILGVDVGRAQLHPRLQNEPRLVFLDKVNARNPLPEDLLRRFFAADEPRFFDLIVVDVSFISLSKLIANLVTYLGPQSDLVTLVKPQFELSKDKLDKKGVVRSEEDRQRAKNKCIEVLQQHGLTIMGGVDSPIEGDNGNKECLIWSRLNASHPELEWL
jgi:23S rRNA (cytidine1920-2'-O)/16S rRNA (cytidine1409-2'-O)-methyltransferase